LAELFKRTKHAKYTYLYQGIFREQQMFFNGTVLQRKALDTFVQNEGIQKLLQQLGKTNVAVSGDTRFDRVAAILDY
jgi:3-deoxy-D-manno-octulosonic-acid transferase